MGGFIRCVLILAMSLPAIAWGQVSINIDPAAGEAGGEVDLTVGLSVDGGPAVVATQNELHFADGATVASCSVNRGIHKDATLFNYLPLGCRPGLDCSGVRVLVFSLANIAPIPSGSILYSCTVSIDSAIPLGRELEITCTDPGASTADGRLLETACPEGSITVVEPMPPPCVGDCNGDDLVVVSELLAGVNVLLERAVVETCQAFDRDFDTTVSIDELVAGIGRALHGCPK